jgi:adenylate cyclase
MLLPLNSCQAPSGEWIVHSKADKLPRMSNNNVSHKLTAILYADVAGYSRLTGDDEVGTHRRVMSALDFASEIIKDGGGNVLRYAGDAILAEFSSVVAVANAAIAIQNALQSRNQDIPEQQQVCVRIGINIGEVLEDRDEIFGEGVNLAARLEAAAQPGGICVSAAVHEQIVGKVDIRFEDGGLEEFKNIAKPVHVYYWHPDMAAGENQGMAIQATFAPDLVLPDKPSIAVLPFDNMSTDPEQVFFADGISEDITTELSKFRSLFVIARNSSFAFKGQTIDVKDVSKKLGVRYVVEGSVRRSGNRVRITAQLIDAVDDKHLWAERYDRELEDIFTVQDEVTHAIVSTIEPQLATTERQRARRKPTDNLGAWECYQRGLWHLYQYQSDDLAQGLTLLERAISLDSTFSSAYAGLALSLYYRVVLGFASERDADMSRALEAGKTAVRLDENDPFAHVALARIYTLHGEHDTAIAQCDIAISLTPSYANAHFGRAHSLWMSGQALQAIASHDEAMRLSPRDPILWAFMASKAIALIMLGRYDEGLDWARKAQRQPSTALWAFLPEASALALLDRNDEAGAALARARELRHEVSVRFVDEVLPITDAAYRKIFVGGLIKAGMPE